MITLISWYFQATHLSSLDSRGWGSGLRSNRLVFHRSYDLIGTFTIMASTWSCSTNLQQRHCLFVPYILTILALKCFYSGVWKRAGRGNDWWTPIIIFVKVFLHRIVSNLTKLKLRNGSRTAQRRQNESVGDLLRIGTVWLHIYGQIGKMTWNQGPVISSQTRPV